MMPPTPGARGVAVATADPRVPGATPPPTPAPHGPPILVGPPTPARHRLPPYVFKHPVLAAHEVVAHVGMRPGFKRWLP